MSTSKTRPPISRLLCYGAIDVVLVVVFAAIGRVSHHESLVDLPTTFWPFAVGLLAGWGISRFWLDPLRVNWVGVIIVAVTVVVGMVLRGVSGQGVEPAFVIVATVVLGVFLLGWRLIASAIGSALARSRTGRSRPRRFD